MQTINDSTFHGLASKACEICKETTVDNLILHGTLKFEEVDSGFIKTNEASADKWQEEKRPIELLFNHGEFIHKAGNGHKYITDELKRKVDSNRAVISLMNMENIVGSGDDPIPSFLSLQFGFNDENNKELIVTAYFRALEVSTFLPINMAEIALLIRKVKIQIPSIELIRLTIHAFKAHCKEQFDCFIKCEIDTICPMIIAKMVSEKKTETIKGWVSIKQTQVTSQVNTEGLKSLISALRVWPDKYNRELAENLDLALEHMIELKEVRKSSTYTKSIYELENKIDKYLENAIKLLSEESSGT